MSGFPKDFFFGAAAASYQIEGAADVDGRGPSVWDAFCRRPGAVKHGDHGGVACDHYHRYREDVALMSQLGLQAYRLSIAWPRVMPLGTGGVETRGLDFYDRLVDALLEAGITPWVTLFHWDLPLALERRGGWLNRASADWFAEYVGVVVDRLSDRVRHWITLNEPQVYLAAGHAEGWHAPGRKLGRRDQLLAAHHTMLAHGDAVAVIRSRAQLEPQVGMALQCVGKYPASDRVEDVEAARSAMFGTPSGNLWNLAWFADPLFRGQYPAEELAVYGEDAIEPEPGDMERIAAPLDFCGLNVYGGEEVRQGPDDQPLESVAPPGAARTSFGWLVAPRALQYAVRFFGERYGVPMYITENGMANLDWVGSDGCVHDPQRIDYTRRYLAELERGIAAGADVRGYFHWSILDNFEWAEGYSQRFGLIHVDYATGKRTLKDSAHWYADVIRTRGASIHAAPHGAESGSADEFGKATEGINQPGGMAWQR